jgi:hypothetical protein
MPYPTLNQIEGLLDPAPDWMWTMDILRGGSVLLSNLHVLEVQFPFLYLEVEGRYRAGTYIFFPGKNNIDKVTVSFYETEDFFVLQAFTLWQSLIVDDDNIHALPKDYLGSCVLTCYDGAGNQRIQCNLSGCWPAQLSDWSLNYSSSNHLQVQVQFSVNASKFTFFTKTGAQIMPTANPALTAQQNLGAQVNPFTNNLTGGLATTST